MIYKPRTIPLELLVLKTLSPRIDLPQQVKQYYFNLEKGYEGEQKFDLFTEKLTSNVIILNDLLFKTNTTTFQIDSLLITADAIYLYEIKNYEGDYYYDAQQDKFYKIPNSEITNPLHQLARTESLLSRLIQQLGWNTPVKSYLVFINDSFTLYRSPLNRPIIHPTQIRTHVQQLNQIRTKLKRSHHHLAEKLLQLHIEDSPFTQIPPYDYEQLKKGISCSQCRSLSNFIKGKLCICSTCGHKELVAEAVMRSVKELQLLFPNRKITTNLMHDWCQIIENKQRIQRILSRHMQKKGSNGRGVYYI